MEAGIQRKMKLIGDEGCYFLCLLKAAGIPENKVLDAYDECLERGYIGEDCFVKDGVSILRLFGVNVTQLQKCDAGSESTLYPYKVKIGCWQNGRYTHFVLHNDGGNIWDPLGDSNTVKNGEIKSWRLYH